MPQPPKDNGENLSEVIETLENRAVVLDQAIMLMGMHLGELQQIGNGATEEQQARQLNLLMAQTVIAVERLVSLHEATVSTVQKLRARGRIATPDLSLIGPDGQRLSVKPKRERKLRPLNPAS